MREWTRLSAASILAVFTIIFANAFYPSAFAEESGNFRSREHQLHSQLGTEDDIRAEIEFGRNIAARLLARMALYEKPELTRYVNLVGQGLATYSSRSDIAFYFAVIDEENINAYSTPGGYIFITRGAIEAMEDEAQLAGVLAHEIAHVSEKHIVKEFNIKGNDDSKLSGVSRLVGASQDAARVAFFQAVDKALDILLDKGFKYEDERESDRVAVYLMTQAGYDSAGLHRFLKKIQTMNSDAANKASPTHPATTDRLNLLQTAIDDSGVKPLSQPTGKKRFASYANKK